MPYAAPRSPWTAACPGRCSASSYFMKSPSVQYHDSVAHDNVEAFIQGNDNTVEDLATFLAG